MIRLLSQEDSVPWSLLLEADPERQLVKKYLATGTTLVYIEQTKIVGILVYQMNETDVEIMNLSVDPGSQRKGIGKQLIDYATKEITLHRTTQKKILIRTGDLSYGPLSLYKKCGFKEIKRVENYFINNYSTPIYEEGIQLKHQVVLGLDLVNY